jgi:hypothetical protein
MVLLAAWLNTVMVLLSAQPNVPHVFSVLGFSLAFQFNIICAHSCGGSVREVTSVYWIQHLNSAWPWNSISIASPNDCCVLSD